MAGDTGAQALSNGPAAAGASAQPAQDASILSGLGGIADWLFGGVANVAAGAGQNFLSGIGGALGAGIESGFVAVLRDMWAVMVGPVFIAIGLLVLFFTLTYYNKDDLLGIAQTAGMAAMAF